MINNNTKFDSLTFSKNGLLLKYRNEQEIEIPFANLGQIYIKKHKLNPIVEFLGISFPFLFVYMAIQYLPFDLMILVSIITIISIFKCVVNYKWYRFNIQLKDGTSFKKKISLDLKTENVSILEKVRTEFIYYNSSALASA